MVEGRKFYQKPTPLKRGDKLIKTPNFYEANESYTIIIQLFVFDMVADFATNQPTVYFCGRLNHEL